MRWWTLIVIAAALATVQQVAGSRILFVSPIASKSHKGFFTAVVNKLADEGHQVTLVSPYKPSKERKNVREIVLQDVDISKLLPNVFEGNTAASSKVMADVAPILCSDALAKKEVQDLLKEEFDLGMITIFMSDCFLSLLHQLQIPFIHVCPAGLLGPVSSLVGNPSFPSFVTAALLHKFHPFTFPERTINTLADTMIDAIVQNYVTPKMDTECRRRGLCPKNMPSLTELRTNGSLLFINSVKGTETPPRPVVPAVIHIGGIHCQKSKPLPKDLEEWVAGAGEDGFIFFSLGSVVQPSTMPEEYLKILIKVLGSLKQRVLWKWNEDTMADLPSNVRLGKWLPQQDILGDPRLRVFITHGGGLSTQESIYHGTPVIGLPIFADQMTNMVEVQQQGWGRVLKWEELTPQLLEDTIHFVINDEKLRTEVKRRSALMLDQPMDPGETAKYWTEYVIRHKGAHHLRSPTLSLSWYQLYNVDVWVTVLGIALGVLFILLKLIWAIFRCLCFSKSKAKKE